MVTATCIHKVAFWFAAGYYQFYLEDLGVDRRTRETDSITAHMQQRLIQQPGCLTVFTTSYSLVLVTFQVLAAAVPHVVRG